MIDVAQRLALAEHLLDTGAPGRAGEVLDQVAADAMDDHRFWLLRAVVASEGDAPEAALAAAGAGLARFPESVPLRVVAGHSLRQLDRLAEAEEALLAALALDPEHTTALCEYAHVVALVGQLDKARRLVGRAAALHPDDPAVLTARYLVAHLSGDDAETARAARELAQHRQGDASALAVLGVEALKRGDVRSTVDLLGRAARADVRVVESVGAHAFREVRLMSHPLLWPLWPVERFGTVPLWLAGVGTITALERAGYPVAAGVVAVCWILWVVYTWVAPPLVRRLYGGAR